MKQNKKTNKKEKESVPLEYHRQLSRDPATLYQDVMMKIKGEAGACEPSWAIA